MEDKQKQSDVPSLDLQHGSGSMLATARKKQQKTIKEIADELNLSVTQVKLIELDQTDGLPEPTYVRGYIRGYAKLLGLNPDEVLQNYLNPNWQQNSKLNDIPKGIGTTTQESGGVGFFTPFKTILLLIILGALGYFWFTGAFSNIEASKLVTSVNSRPGDRVNLVVSPQPKLLSGADTSPAGDSQQSSDLSDPSATIAIESSKIENHLALSFSDTSWVDIRDDKDTRLAYKSYAAGEILEVSSELPLRVFIGNAAGVSVEYNGVPFDIRDYREGVYAKFEVGEKE
ncbi:MAG: cytoskeleton protein RodZ [Arenicella sp.]|jgi:cytoskeleton protein RodZ